ncbi:MAG: hypothetical protein QXR65_05295 [Candidatus Bathyarchaeia archaeon]
MGLRWFNGVKKLKKPQQNRRRSVEAARMRGIAYENLQPLKSLPPPGGSHEG